MADSVTAITPVYTIVPDVKHTTLVHSQEPQAIVVTANTSDSVVPSLLELSTVVQAGAPGPRGEAATVETPINLLYDNGYLTRVEYASGNTKEFSYYNGQLAYSIYRTPIESVTSTYTYNSDGMLISIAVSKESTV